MELSIRTAVLGLANSFCFGYSKTWLSDVVLDLEGWSVTRLSPGRLVCECACMRLKRESDVGRGG